MEIDDDIDEEDSIEEENPTDKSNILKEQQYWKTYFIPNYVYMPNKCPMCKHNNITIGNGNTLLNPKILICNNYKCRYRCNLKNYSFLKIFPKIQSSTIMKILKYFILEKKMALK